MSNWSTKDLAAYYKRMGVKNPVERACGTGYAKYKAQPTVVDGIRFDSKKEARDYQTLRIAEKAGVISNLELQPKFLLQEKFTDASGKKHRAVFYVGDFRFLRDGRTVVVDSKGMKTQAYRVKIKLFLAKYPDLVFEEWGKR